MLNTSIARLNGVTKRRHNCGCRMTEVKQFNWSMIFPLTYQYPDNLYLDCLYISSFGSFKFGCFNISLYNHPTLYLSPIVRVRRRRRSRRARLLLISQSTHTVCTFVIFRSFVLYCMITLRVAHT